MDRSRYQYQASISWRKLKRSNARWSTFVRQYYRQWVGAIAVAIVLGFLFRDAAGLFAGVMLGVMARDVGYIRSVQAIWPVTPFSDQKEPA